MTLSAIKNKKKPIANNALLCIAILLMPLTLIFGNEIKGGIIKGLSLSFLNIIPTIFPFFVLTDLWLSTIDFKHNGLSSRCFERLFNVNGCAVSSFIIGSVCGFPLGVKTAVELYNENKINKSELESLICFVNNPSAAFVISGIGAGMCGDISLGIKLYFSTIFSAIIIGLIFKNKENKTTFSKEITRQNFDFVGSIRSAAYSSISVCAYIAFFSGVIALVGAIWKNETFSILISPFLELTSASESIYASRSVIGIWTNPLLAFSLGFSGFCVHMQAFSFLPKDVSKIKYLLAKFLHGVASALLILLFR